MKWLVLILACCFFTGLILMGLTTIEIINTPNLAVILLAIPLLTVVGVVLAALVMVV